MNSWLKRFCYNRFRGMWAQGKDGYLHDTGWFRSFQERQAVDLSGQPVPWLGYPFVEFLSKRLSPAMQMFEFGCGNGTLYWAGRVGNIVSCELNRAWFDKISPRLPDNAQVIWAPDGPEYEATILNTGKRYHLVLVDGIRREEAAATALEALTSDGVMILDDSFRSEYRPIFERMQFAGFRKLEISGAAPIHNNYDETTVFYRDGNCLGI